MLCIADRVGRSFVQPIRPLATYAQTLGDRRPPRREPSGPPEVRDLGATLQRLVGRIELLLARERVGLRPVPPVAYADHLAAAPHRRSRSGDEKDRLSEDLDRLAGHGRPRGQRGPAFRAGGARRRHARVAVLADRAAFWAPLAEDQGRPFTVDVPTARRPRCTPAADLAALVDVLLDNVFTHTPEGRRLRCSRPRAPTGGLVLTVDDDGPGFPDEVDVVRRGESGADSSGLGLAIAHKTATESGGGLWWALALRRRPGGRGARHRPDASGDGDAGGAVRAAAGLATA